MARSKLTLAEKLERKERLAEKREARRLAKEKKEQEKATSENRAARTSGTSISSNDTKSTGTSPMQPDNCLIFSISNDAQNHFLSFLPARDLGALTLTCRQWNQLLVGGMIHFGEAT